MTGTISPGRARAAHPDGDVLAERPAGAGQPAATGDEAGPGRRGTHWARLGLVALAVLLAASAALAAVAVPDALHRRGVDQGRDGALVAARSGAVDMLSYDYRSVDAALARMQHDAVPSLANSLSTQQATLRHTIVSGQVVATASVVAGALDSYHGEAATALLFVDQTTRSKATPTPTTSRYRVVVGLHRSDGRWLLSGFDPQ